ncbi:MAG TPA: peptide ABC transporter substrate-binding protein [Pyrinomonadaceae bacterium]|jgi:ABC-type oligopeptide transport system substrate-binding subunit|nr:peptide ABC transporter substrate-binding protein [Pyrinomonadaceae bacterium]
MSVFRSSRIPIIIALVALALIISACSSLDKNSKYFGKNKPPQGQVLRYITGAEPETLDPQPMTGQPESRIAAALFDGLVEYDEKTVMPRPSLATSWDINANGTVWTFHLRNDAKWTDGKPLTAHDFVYSWRRAVSPELAAPYASMMYESIKIDNAKAYSAQLAFVRDPATGRFMIEGDLERAGEHGPLNFTGPAPVNYDLPPTTTDATATPATPQAATTTTAGAGAAAGGGERASEAKIALKDPYFLLPADAEARNKILNGDPSKKTEPNQKLARFLEGKEFVPATKENMGVRALDDYTFQVTLEAPTAFFHKIILHQFFRPVPRQAIEKYGDALWVKQGNIVTSGAFKLTEWSPYEKIVVERNPLFWDNANTKLDKIIFPSVEELTTGMNMYKAGEVDATQSNEVPPPWRNQIKETKKDYVFGPYLQIEYVAMKTSMKPLDDLRVRKAFSMAINRQILADQAPGRLPLTGFTPRMEGYENAEGTGYNPDEARRLLAEAGFPGGKGFPEIEIVYNTAESTKQTMEFVQSMLKRELGIKVELTNQEWRVYLDNTRSDKMKFNGLSRRAWIGDYVDPNTFLDLMTSASTNNGTGWKDKKYDAMLLAANAETDAPKRMKMLKEAEGYMLSQQPVIPLFIGPSSLMRKPYVRNLEANLLDQHDWRQVWIDHNWRDEESAPVALALPFDVRSFPAIARLVVTGGR